MPCSDTLGLNGGLTSVGTWTSLVLGPRPYVIICRWPSLKLIGFSRSPVAPVNVPGVRPLENGGWDQADSQSVSSIGVFLTSLIHLAICSLESASNSRAECLRKPALRFLHLTLRALSRWRINDIHPGRELSAWKRWVGQYLLPLYFVLPFWFIITKRAFPNKQVNM